MTEKRVEVEWIDSTSKGGWGDKQSHLATAEPDLHHRSVGYLLRDDDLGVLLVQSMADNYEAVAESLLIPRMAIQKVKVLR